MKVLWELKWTCVVLSTCVCLLCSFGCKRVYCTLVNLWWPQWNHTLSPQPQPQPQPQLHHHPLKESLCKLQYWWIFCYSVALRKYLFTFYYFYVIFPILTIFSFLFLPICLEQNWFVFTPVTITFHFPSYIFIIATYQKFLVHHSDHQYYVTWIFQILYNFLNHYL